MEDCYFRHRSSVQMEERMDRNKIINKIDKLKAEHPEQKNHCGNAKRFS